jgi:hypothetical protein
MDYVDESVHKALKTRPSGVRESHSSDQLLVAEAQISGVFFPWNKQYKIWWTFTCVAAIFTYFFETYEIAFGSDNIVANLIEGFLLAIFCADILVTFNLAFYENEVMVFQRKSIVKNYLKMFFWIDLIGVFPFQTIALSVTEVQPEPRQALLLKLLRMLRLVRLHRLAKFQDFLQYNPRISFMTFTLVRNIAATLSASHFWACGIYYLARLREFDDTTWLGPLVRNFNGLERFVVSLYWSVVTFATVGYGDFSPTNADEQILGITAIVTNIVIAAWIIGSITLLIVKGDETTGEYRDALQTLTNYANMHGFDETFQKKLQNQLRLEFNNREISDETVLANFPSAVRRKVLRKLYLRYLWKTGLMKDVRQQFVDAFLTNCKVEIFSPGEEIVERGSISSDLFLLVGGMASINTYDLSDGRSVTLFSDDSSISRRSHLSRSKTIEAGEFIGDIGFFTESPQGLFSA